MTHPEGREGSRDSGNGSKACDTITGYGLGQLHFILAAHRERLELQMTAQGIVHGEHFSLLIGAAGPEEATQAVVAFARDDVDVKVGDALADDVVDGDKAAVRFHYFLHFSGEHLRVGEKWADQGGGEIRQSGVVHFRNQQDVAGKKWADVEEGHGNFVFENNFGFEFARNNFAKQARLVLPCVRLGGFFAGVGFSHGHKINT